MTPSEADLAGRVVERLHRVQDLLASVCDDPGGHGHESVNASIAVEVADDGRLVRLVRLSLSPLCMTGCTAGQLEDVINAAVVAAMGAAIH